MHNRNFNAKTTNLDSYCSYDNLKNHTDYIENKNLMSADYSPSTAEPNKAFTNLSTQSASYSYRIYDKFNDLTDYKSYQENKDDTTHNFAKSSQNHIIKKKPTWMISRNYSLIEDDNQKLTHNNFNSVDENKLNNLSSSIRRSLAKPLICRRCTKIVYEAEKIIAAGNIWHRRCFRCRECGKSLEPGKFCDREGEIFCNKCYAKNFGPKGIGCGVGAGILQMHQ